MIMKMKEIIILSMLTKKKKNNINNENNDKGEKKSRIKTKVERARISLKKATHTNKEKFLP